MGDAKTAEARRREWARTAHDALHALQECECCGLPNATKRPGLGYLCNMCTVHTEWWQADGRGGPDMPSGPAYDTRVAQDHEAARLAFPDLTAAHLAIHKAVEDRPLRAETTASDTRPFDRAFADLCREHGMVAVWVGAVDGIILTGGHKEWNQTVHGIIHAGMTALAARPAPEQAHSPLWTPGAAKLVIPDQN